MRLATYARGVGGPSQRVFRGTWAVRLAMRSPLTITPCSSTRPTFAFVLTSTPSRGEETGRDLVEHGPEEMIVVLVNDRDGDRRPCEPARGVETAETSADDDDAWEVRV